MTEETTLSPPALNLPDWMVLETDDDWTDQDEMPGYHFYDNTIKLYFDVPSHVYYKFDEEGVRQDIDGVTTVLDVINKPFLKAWAAKVAIEFVSAQCIQPTGEFTKWSTEEFLAMLHEAKGQHKVRLDIAGDIGHIAHDILEHSIRFAIDNTGGVVHELKRVPEEDTDANRMAINCANVAFGWMQRHNVRWLTTERKIYSRMYNYAGTEDGQAIVDSCGDLKCCGDRVFKDRRSIIDFKSSNQLSESYPLQAAAYQFAEIEEFGQSITDRWILRLGKETDDFEPWYLPADEFEADFEAFLAALNLHRGLKEITKRRRDGKAAIRFLLKQERDRLRAIKDEEDRLERLRIREEKKAATKARKAAEDVLYKDLRKHKVPPPEAKEYVSISFPKPKKAEVAEEEFSEEFEIQLSVPSPTKTKPEPFEEEWTMTMPSKGK